MNWTDEQDATVRTMAAQGYGWKEIALALGRTFNSVTGYAARRGIKFVGKRKPEPKIKPAVNSEAKERTCMMCRESFPSSWAGERVCKTCRRGKVWRSGERAVM